MPIDRQPDDRISRWLEAEAPTQLPDRVLRATFERTRRTRQKGGWRALLGRWDVNRLVLGLGGAAVAVVIAALALGVYVNNPRPGVGGPATAPAASPSATASSEASPTAQPTVTRPTATPEPPDPTPAALPEGPFVLVYEMLFGVRTTVTIPAPDWHGMQYSTALEKHGTAGPPQGAALVVYGGDMFVYGDPCAWESTRPDNPAASLDELVAALSAQASRDATEPIDVTVGGHPGKMLTLQVPEDAVFTDCDGGEFRTLMEVSSSGDEAPSSHQGPGQISEVWVVDVDGRLVYFDAGYFAATPAEYVEEMRAIVESATFETR